MDWQTLLSSNRLRRPDAAVNEDRSPFQQDLDRIVFSAAFRRLAHKTQVHPLSPNDHVHTRLTHSIEVASVGRSLGTIVGNNIATGLREPSITGNTFGDIVQAACLAHDIGNPPFGHSGEEAIRDWFKRYSSKSNNGQAFGLSDAQCEDFRQFEGNAQGFRILTQLENHKGNGGLQLTCAVLGAFSKYPRSSKKHSSHDDNYVGGKKFGFFQAEKCNFCEVANCLALLRKADDYWSRHPLAFLVEAADDICYTIIDIEDGYELKYLSFCEAKEILSAIADDGTNLSLSMGQPDQIAKLRAIAIDKLVTKVAEVFLQNQRALLDGSFSEDLLTKTQFRSEIIGAKELAKKNLYLSDRKAKLEIAGSAVISGLLDTFSEVVSALEEVGYDPSKLKGKAQQLARLMDGTLTSVTDSYGALLCVTDFISGMTDRYAVDLYRALKGVSTIP